MWRGVGSRTTALREEGRACPALPERRRRALRGIVGTLACRYATGHFEQTDHPIIRSAEPGEQRSWCYPDELMFRLRAS